MNDKNFDSQSESIRVKRDRAFKWQTINLQHALVINRTLSSIVVDANKVIFIVNIFGAESPKCTLLFTLAYAYKNEVYLGL